MHMFFKRYIYYIVIILLIIISLTLFIGKWNKKNSFDPILMRIGDKEKKLSEFLREANYNFQIDTVKSINYIKQLDNYINAELYFSSQFSSKLRDTIQFSIDKENDILSNLLYKNKTKNILENDKYYEICSEKNNEILILDYVWLPDSLEKTSIKIKELLDAGENIEYFRLLTDYNEMVLNNVLFFPKRLIKGGTLNHEIQDIAYKLKENEVKLIHCKSGIYIIRLFKKFHNNDHYNLELEKENINNRILNAKSEENKEYLCNPSLFNKKVLINTNKLSLLDFYFKSINESQTSSKNSNTVIAKSFNGNEILYSEFLKYLNNLPLNIQVLLTENQAQLILYEFILIEMLKTEILDALDDKTKNYRENLMVKKLIKSKYLDCNEYHFNKDSIILEMSNWINQFLLTRNDQSSLYILLLSEAYRNNLESDKDILDKLSVYESYLNKKSLLQKFSALNSCKTISINYHTLDTLNIDTHFTNNKKVIANYGNWKLTTNLFLKYIKDLTLETKLELIETKNCFELIEYIAKKELNYENIDRNKLVIDKTLFYSKSENSFLKTIYDYVTLSKTDVIASYDTIEICVDDLRNIFFSLNPTDKQQLINEITREEFLTKLLRRLALEREVNNCQLNIQNLNYKIENNIMDNDKLFFQLFGCDVNIKPKGVEGIYFQLAIKKLLEEKLNEIFNHQLKKEKVYLNFDVLNQLNLNTNMSKYKDCFIPLELAP